MPRILLAASTLGYQTRSLAEAARRLGVDVTLATDRCHILPDPWLDHAIPIRFEHPVESADALARELASTHIDGVIALSDPPTTIAALTAQRLGVPFHPPEATERSRDKALARAAFAAAGLPVPRSFTLSADQDPRAPARIAPYPCVLKPTRLSASRGVIRANNPEEFVAAFARIGHIMESVGPSAPAERYIQIEHYIPGREFAIEALMTRGELQILAIFDKPDPLEGPHFEETLYITPSREPQPIQDAIAAAVRHAVRALGLFHGPVHAEARVNSAGVWMLEAAARPIGGLCARVLEFNGDISLEELLVRHAIGDMPADLTPARPASGVMMIPIPRPGIFHSASGLDGALATPGIDDAIVTAIPGQHLLPPPEGGSYLGFLFASGAEPGSVEASLRHAHAQLNFEILSALDIISR